MFDSCKIPLVIPIDELVDTSSQLNQVERNLVTCMNKNKGLFVILHGLIIKDNQVDHYTHLLLSKNKSKIIGGLLGNVLRRD